MLALGQGCGAGVGPGVGLGVGPGVGPGVGAKVGLGVGPGVGASVRPPGGAPPIVGPGVWHRGGCRGRLRCGAGRWLRCRAWAGAQGWGRRWTWGWAGGGGCSRGWGWNCCWARCRGRRGGCCWCLGRSQSWGGCWARCRRWGRRDGLPCRKWCRTGSRCGGQCADDVAGVRLRLRSRERGKYILLHRMAHAAALPTRSMSFMFVTRTCCQPRLLALTWAHKVNTGGSADMLAGVTIMASSDALSTKCYAGPGRPAFAALL